MHYVRTKTRVKVYMHDLKKAKQIDVLSYLNKCGVNYKYIIKQSCVSMPLKHEPYAKYLLLEFKRD